MTNYNQEIGQKLREARLKAELTQEKAAKRLGMERSNLTHIEKGRSPMALNQLLQIPRLYGCKITDVLPESVVTAQDRQRAKDPDLQDIIDAWPELTEDVKVVLMNQFETLVKLNRSQRR